MTSSYSIISSDIEQHPHETISRSRTILLFSLAILALGLILLLFHSGNASATCVYPGSGDWVVLNSETCSVSSPATIDVSGDVIVQNGGNLTINGIELRMDGSSNGQRKIDVMNGGTFNAYSSATVRAVNTAYHYKFLIRAGATVNIKDSTVMHSGFDPLNDDTVGIRVESGGVSISRSTFSNNYAGIYLKDVAIRIDNSTFENNRYGILVTGATNVPTIVDNTIRNNKDGIMVIDSDPVILSNLIQNNTDNGIYLLKSNATVKNNDIFDNDYGIGFLTASPSVTGNKISNNYMGLKGFFGDIIIENNDLKGNVDHAAYLVNTGGRFKENYVLGPVIFMPNQGNGILVRGSTTSIQDNDIFDVDSIAIRIEARSNLEVTGNRIRYSYLYGVEIEDAIVKFENNEIKHIPYAMSISTASGSIRNNTFLNTTTTLDVLWSEDSLVIEDNSFTDSSKRALYLYECQPLVKHNTFVDNPRAIKAIYSRASIVGNTFTDNGISIDITSGSDIHVADNVVMHGNYTIFSTMSSATMVNNTISFSANFSLYFTNDSYAKLIDNRISGNDRRGVYFLRSSGVLINNNITDSGTGVYGFMADISFVNNTIHGNDVGIFLNDSVAVLKGDTIRDNTVFGMLGSGVTVSMDGVHVHDNVEGINFLFSEIFIVDCTFANNSKGVSGLTATSISINGSEFLDHDAEGVYIVDSEATIEGSTFINNSYGIRTLRSPITIESSTFTTGGIGLYSEQTDLVIEDSSFELLNVTGIKVINGDVRVIGSEFKENQVGIDIDNGTLTVESSDIRDSVETGILTSEATVLVKGTRVIGNMDGILDLKGSTIEIFDCNISSNEMFGVYTDQNSVSVTMTITKRIILLDNSFLLNGKMVIEDGGHLILLRVHVEFYSGIAGDSGLTVRTGGKLVVRESLFSAYDDQSGYHFIAEKGSGLTISNATIRHIGRGFSGRNSGLLVQTTYASIFDTLFENNTIGLYIYQTNFAGYDIRFKDNVNGFKAVEAEIDLVNSSIKGSSGNDVILLASTARLLNTEFFFTKAEIQDAGSLLIVKWYLHVSVVWDDGQPVDGAQVMIVDQADDMLTGSTDNQGFLRWLVIKEYQKKGTDPSGYFSFSPLKITVTEKDLTVEITEFVGSSTTVIVTMADHTPPIIKVTTPESGSALYDSSVTMIGTASDEGSSVISVEVSIDGMTWIFANGTSSWFANLTVPEGNHTLHIRATDARNNVGKMTIIIDIDLTSALLEIYYPLNGMVTNSSSITVYGKTHAGADLLINDDVVTVEKNGTFTYQMQLTEGENFLHAKALANNGIMVMEVDLVIIRDTTRPEISLLHPEAGSLVNTSSVTFSVMADEEAVFFINGREVVTYGGVADIQLELVEGENIVRVRAIDMAGNVNETSFKLILDLTPPDLVLERPLDPSFSTTKERIVIEGRTEPGANLTIDGEPVDVAADGTFMVKYKLRLGKNTITLVSKDETGNVNVLTLMVKRNEVIDNSNYMWLVILTVITVAALDVAIIMYFKRYYRPKDKAGMTSGQDEEEGLDEDGYEEDEPQERIRPRRERSSARADRMIDGEDQETEFDEEDLEEF